MISAFSFSKTVYKVVLHGLGTSKKKMYTLPYVTLCGFCPQLFFVIFLYFNCLSSGWWL